MEKFWLQDPEKHDYPAAADYLELLFIREEAEKMVALLKECKNGNQKSERHFTGKRIALISGYQHSCAYRHEKSKKGQKAITHIAGSVQL